MTIELSNVRFGYAGPAERPVIDIKHWSVGLEERVLVHGPSGGGKSTLLNLISGMLMPQSGEITVAGNRLDRMTGRQRDLYRAAHIGYVFQRFNLIPHLDAVDNLAVANYFAKKMKPAATRARIECLLGDLNISPSIGCLPANALSTGQQQRVAIARALINQPKLLIADEPTSALDMENRDKFMSLITELATSYKTTLLFVSHDLSLSHYFDRVEGLSSFCRNGEN